MNTIKLLSSVVILAFSILITNTSQAQELSITEFVLVDADSDQDIQVINDGAVIDIATLPTTNISIIAKTSPETVGSVVFSYDNRRKLENHVPYAIKGDSPRGNYNRWNYDLRTYELTATPYSRGRKKGVKGQSKTISFTFTDGIDTNGIEVSEFVLVDADSNVELQIINDEDVIDIATLPTANFSIVAKTTPETVGSVYFRYGNRKKLENITPYAIAGDKPRGDYNRWNYDLRSYELTATPYSRKKKRGFAGQPKTVNFTFVNNIVVTEFVLVDADNDVELQVINDGDTININDLPTENISVIAKINTPYPGSVQFSYAGRTRTENFVPYAIAGDNLRGDFNSWNYELTTYELTATPYSERKRRGQVGTAKTVTFTLIKDDDPVDPPTDPVDPPVVSKLYISADETSPLLNLIELENDDNTSFYASRNGAVVLFKADGTQVFIELDAQGEVTKIYDSLGTTEINVNCGDTSCSVSAEENDEQFLFNIAVNNAGNDLSEISAISSLITDNSVFVNVQRCGATFDEANTVASLCPSVENKQYCTASLGAQVDTGRYEVNLPLLSEAAEVLGEDDITLHTSTVGAFCSQTPERVLANDVICSTLATNSVSLSTFCTEALSSLTESCDKSVTETPAELSAEQKLAEVFADTASGESNVVVSTLDVGSTPFVTESLVSALSPEIDLDAGTTPSIDRLLINDNVVGETSIFLPARQEYQLVAIVSCVDLFSATYDGLITVSGTDGYVDENDSFAPLEDDFDFIDARIGLTVPGGGESVEDTLDVSVLLRSNDQVVTTQQIKVIFE
ncbi:MAG: hypothetical protein AAF984_09270 [Verrucomicrobiota bacterium]